MNKIGKIAHNISVQNTSFQYFCKNFLESIKNCISSLLWATIFDVGLQRDRDIL